MVHCSDLAPDFSYVCTTILYLIAHLGIPDQDHCGPRAAVPVMHSGMCAGNRRRACIIRSACQCRNKTTLPSRTLPPAFPHPSVQNRPLTLQRGTMESITSRFDSRSHKTQLVFTALAASALTAAAITSYNSYSRQQKRNELNRQVLTSVATDSSSSERGGGGSGRKRRGTLPPPPEQIYLNGGMDYGSGELNGSGESNGSGEVNGNEELTGSGELNGSGEVNGSGESNGNGELNGSASSANYDEDLVREQLARNYAFFGEEGMKKIRGASVAVIGCGGVGSWAAVMLARSYVCFLFLSKTIRS